jgi:hypothetical protein
MEPPSYKWRIPVYWDMLNRVVAPKYDARRDNTIVGNLHLLYVLKSSGNIARNLKAHKRRRNMTALLLSILGLTEWTSESPKVLILQDWSMQVWVILSTGSRSRDSAVGIATHYGLDGPGSNPGGGEIFHTRQDRLWAPPLPQPPIQWVPGLSRG